MSGVVLRCPNCGTTRATTGECEACHEAQVRYFCTNHEPGRWLDAKACTQCGARFGDPVRPPAAPAPPATVRRPARATARTPAPASASTSRPPHTSAKRPRADDSRWGRREPLPPSAEEEEFATRDERVDGRFASWQELLWAIARARRSREDAPISREVPARGPGVGGCLLRFVLLIVFFVVALVIAPFLFGGFLFGIY